MGPKYYAMRYGGDWTPPIILWQYDWIPREKNCDFSFSKWLLFESVFLSLGIVISISTRDLNHSHSHRKFFDKGLGPEIPLYWQDDVRLRT